MSDRDFEKRLIDSGAKTVSETEIAKVVARSEQIQGKFRIGGPLRRFLDDGRLLIALIKDYSSRTYRKVPVGVIGAVAFTLLYVFNPLDLLPDVLPIVGQIDDAALVAACLMLVEHDLQAYKAWKAANDAGPRLPADTSNPRA
jgi:uncharacterized membrane protein YkvA (DUF1232 family)